MNVLELVVKLSFNNHVLDVGTLTIGIDDSGDNIVNPINMWNIAGNQGDFWHKGSLPIGKRISFFQVILVFFYSIISFFWA